MTGEDNYYIFKTGTYKVGRKGINYNVLFLISEGKFMLGMNFCNPLC